MSGPSVLDLVGDIRGAVERLPKEAIVDILVYVFKEYVVEGPAPLANAAPTASDDLEGMSFGEVIRSLQLRLDLPEMELFTVEESGRVLVRVGGRPMAIEAQASRPSPVPIPVVAPPAPPAAPESARPALPVPHALSIQSTPAAAPVRGGAPSVDVRSPASAGPAAASPATAPKMPEPTATPRGLLEID